MRNIGQFYLFCDLRRPCKLSTSIFQNFMALFTTFYKSREAILVDYSDVGYRILIDRRVVVARSVRFVEKDELCTFVWMMNAKMKRLWRREMYPEDHWQLIGWLKRDNDSPKVRARKKAKWKVRLRCIRRCVRCWGSELVWWCYGEAWLTWELVERSKGKKVLDLRWVFTVKGDGLYKAAIKFWNI